MRIITTSSYYVIKLIVFGPQQPRPGAAPRAPRRIRRLRAAPVIPMPMPKPVSRTSLDNKWVQYEVCGTFLGRGMGMNITAQSTGREARAACGQGKEAMCLLSFMNYGSICLFPGKEAMSSRGPRARRTTPDVQKDTDPA